MCQWHKILCSVQSLTTWAPATASARPGHRDHHDPVTSRQAGQPPSPSRALRDMRPFVQVSAHLLDRQLHPFGSMSLRVSGSLSYKCTQYRPWSHWHESDLDRRTSAQARADRPPGAAQPGLGLRASAESDSAASRDLRLEPPGRLGIVDRLNSRAPCCAGEEQCEVLTKSGVRSCAFKLSRVTARPGAATV